MVAVPTPTQSRPETRVFRVEELLAHARAGRIRVPTFQRGFKWERADVGKLLDSIWRGYPIGTLLLWSKLGPAGQVMLGDLTFEVNEHNQAEFPSITTSIPPHVLASHAISAPAMQALLDDDRVAFLELRRDQIDAATARLVDRHAEWNHSDRLSIAALSHEEE